MAVGRGLGSDHTLRSKDLRAAPTAVAADIASPEHSCHAQSLSAALADDGIPGEKAMFEFHWAGWFGKETGDMPGAPELLAFERTQVLCLYGNDGRKSLCPTLEVPFVQRRILRGSHRFDGDFERIAAEVLGWLVSDATSSAAPSCRLR